MHSPSAQSPSVQSYCVCPSVAVAAACTLCNRAFAVLWRVPEYLVQLPGMEFVCFDVHLGRSVGGCTDPKS